MTSSPENSIGYLLQENFTYTQNEESLHNQMNEVYQKIARASNAKEIGIYEETEIITGQRFFGATPQTKRSVYRKVFTFGAILAGGVLNIVHNINGLVSFTSITGTIITAVPDDRPLPYADAIAVTNQVSVLRNGINLVVTNGATAPNITSGILICEYMKA